MVMVHYARFVSFIPYMLDTTFCSPSTLLWATHREFLQVGAGGTREHAHLLACYFLNANINAYLVAGTAMSGTFATAFVCHLDGCFPEEVRVYCHNFHGSVTITFGVLELNKKLAHL